MSIKGPLFMIVFCVGLPLVDVVSRILMQQGFHSSQLLFMEFSIIAFALLPRIRRLKLKETLSKPDMSWHIARILSFFLAANIWVTLLKYVNMGQLYTIGFLAPVFSSLVAAFLFKERFGAWKILSLCMGFMGVLAIIRPGTQQVSIYMIVALLAPILWSVTTVSTKKIINPR